MNADSTASSKKRRPGFTVAAGLIALAIAAAVVVDERGAHRSTDTAASSVAPLVSAPAEDRTAITNTTSGVDAAKPHFERSDESPYEESEHPHGG